MSDISTDLQDCIDKVKPWETDKLSYSHDEIPSVDHLRNTAQSMVHRFRELRGYWQGSNRKIQELEKELSEAKDKYSILKDDYNECGYIALLEDAPTTLYNSDTGRHLGRDVTAKESVSFLRESYDTMERKNRLLSEKLDRLQYIINKASNQLVCYGMRGDKEHTDDVVERTMAILETSEGE